MDASKVGVLAVLDRMFTAPRVKASEVAMRRRDLFQVRAAVAELIEAATEVDRLSRDISAWDDDAAVERAVLRQRAAIARVGGAK